MLNAVNQGVGSGISLCINKLVRGRTAHPHTRTQSDQEAVLPDGLVRCLFKCLLKNVHRVVILKFNKYVKYEDVNLQANEDDINDMIIILMIR